MGKDIILENDREETLEIARLKQENGELSNQVKRLIKAETRLYEYQQELDSRIMEYQKLYELNRKFNSDFDIQSVFEYALEYIIQDLEYERVLFFRQQDYNATYAVCSVDGYYDREEKDAVAELVIKKDDPFLTPLLCGGQEYLICKEDSQENNLEEFRNKFFMNEYLVYALGALTNKPALLVVGNSAENAALYRRISDGKGALLGTGNLVGILSSSVENHASYVCMEKALNQERIAEAKYRSIFENAIEGIFRTTPEGCIIDANPSIASILGYESQDVLRDDLSCFVKDLYVDPSRRVELLRQLAINDAVSDFEAQFRRKDGETIWTLLNVRAVKNAGEIVFLEGFLTDISKRKKAEIALEENKIFLGKIINSIADPIFVKDQNHQWVMLNDAFCCFMSHSHEELIGKSDYDFFPRDKADIFWKKDRNVLDSGKEDITEVELANAEGVVRTIVTKKTLYTDDKGKKFIVGINRDVTDLKQTNEALRKSREMLTNVLDNFPGVVFWKDRNSVYIGCNRSFSNGAGLVDPSEIAGTTDYDLPWGQTEADAYRTDDRQVMESGVPKLNIIETQLQSDGSIVWFDTSKVPLFDPGGAVIGVLGIANDITERKNAENALFEAREELVRKEKLAILGQLSGSVGHELRNPLGIMKNAIYFLKIVLPDADETAREYLDIINQEIDNSIRIITDLLDFARTKTPRTSAVSVRELIDGSLERCVIPENVSIQTDIAGEPPLLRIDPQQMEQVLQNLIVNGMQAMPDGGGLTIHAEDEPEVSMLRISIIDSGEGIAPENIKKLFQPLFTTKARGIGLGLVVCKNLVDANGGRIEVESQLGRGTTFSVWLPSIFK